MAMKPGCHTRPTALKALLLLFCFSLFGAIRHVSTTSGGRYAPFLIWSPTDSMSKTDFASLFTTAAGRLYPTAEGVIASLEKQMLAKDNEALYVLFLDRELDTSSFFQMAGVYGSDNKGKYSALLKTVSSAGEFSEYVTPSSFSVYQDLAARVASTTTNGKAVFVGVASNNEAIETKSLDTPPNKVCVNENACRLVVVDLSSFSSTSRTAGEFAVNFLEQLPAKNKIGAFTSSFDQPQLDDLARNLAAAKPEKPLRILPWQLAGLMTVFVFASAAYLVISCTINIDVPTFHQSKTLVIHKEH